jgi:hypothetical protein
VSFNILEGRAAMSNIKRLLIIIISVVLISLLPLTAHAGDSDNAAGSGDAGGTLTGSGGASENKCGFRMYVVDANGTLKSRVVDLVTQAPSTNGAGLTTRIGGGTLDEILIMPSDMPRPYYYNGSFIGNGLAVKKWMRADGSDGTQNILALIKKYLGSDVHDLFLDQSQEYFCVLEPITWHNIFYGSASGTNSGNCYYGTFNNWMTAYAVMGLSNGGFTKQLDNNVLARCLKLEKDQPNLGLSYPSSGGLIDFYTMGTQGFGIQLYSNLDVSGTHTWDYDLGATPGQPPVSTGKMNIVKNYRTEMFIFFIIII